MSSDRCSYIAAALHGTPMVPVTVCITQIYFRCHVMFVECSRQWPHKLLPPYNSNTHRVWIDPWLLGICLSYSYIEGVASSQLSKAVIATHTHTHTHTHTDIRLSLNGVNYANNSVVNLTAIGTDSANANSEALQCITDLRPCCRQEYIDGIESQMLTGEWYYPNGSRVHGAEIVAPFFRNRGLNDGTVNLLRVNTEVMSPAGRYCCEIPNIAGVNQTLCAGIGEQWL